MLALVVAAICIQEPDGALEQVQFEIRPCKPREAVMVGVRPPLACIFAADSPFFNRARALLGRKYVCVSPGLI